MIKRILKIWFIIGMYELSKYLTNELIIYLQSEDDIDTAPKDFAILDDQIDLNRSFRRQIENDIAKAFEDAFNSSEKEDN
ncbi:transcriptional activator RinB [Staphylococcus haemolyticus]|uniref:Uncharacterized protein n=1 Tax=Staphylococcus haemolyticus (strain JCSC1435) TaxID=279808 RepID=Q4L5I3_STAHJ|nr:hypothetical protein [Staphylococcus haemolyticus]BAE05092.1 unnamed protein product [Staphylococcus haemolyticus JCSC1435]